MKKGLVQLFSLWDQTTDFIHRLSIANRKQHTHTLTHLKYIVQQGVHHLSLRLNCLMVWFDLTCGYRFRLLSFDRDHRVRNPFTFPRHLTYFPSNASKDMDKNEWFVASSTKFLCSSFSLRAVESSLHGTHFAKSSRVRLSAADTFHFVAPGRRVCDPKITGFHEHVRMQLSIA